MLSISVDVFHSFFFKYYFLDKKRPCGSDKKKKKT